MIGIAANLYFLYFVRMAVELASALPSVYATVSAEANVSSVCRICATTVSRHLFSIFSPEGELWDIAEKIGRCLPIMVCTIIFVIVGT
jgi:hypothetical protein